MTTDAASANQYTADSSNPTADLAVKVRLWLVMGAERTTPNQPHRCT